MTKTTDLTKITNHFRDEMIKFIEDNWDEADCCDHLSEEEAECYLGHSVENMSEDEIDEEVAQIQLAYYTDGPATTEEITTMFLKILDAVE